jgi:hypothetical protein
MIPKVYMPSKSKISGDSKELHCSMFVMIDRQNETYICIHDILGTVALKLGLDCDSIKWKHYTERNFLFTLPDKQMRDRFIETNRLMYIGDARIKFKAWAPSEGLSVKPCTLKVCVYF